MSASVFRHDEFTPAEFSPSPELVRIAVVVLAIAGVAGLWKGAAFGMRETPAPAAAAAPASTPAVAIPALAGAADTLIPPQALADPPPTPAVRAPPRAEPQLAPAADLAAPIAPAEATAGPARQVFAEPAAAPEVVIEAPPPPEEEFLPD